MLRLLHSLLLMLLTHHTRTAYVTDHPTFAARLDKLYEKLEKITITPLSGPNLDTSPDEKLYAKLDRLNSLTLERELTDEDEALLSSMEQQWGVNGDQLERVAKDLQSWKDVVKSEKLIEEYGDSDWMDEELQYMGEGDYANDDWDYSDQESSTAKPSVVTPSAFTKREHISRVVVSAADPIAATNERPRILDDSAATKEQRITYQGAVYDHIRSVLRAGKCLTPQPRWLTMRQLAPAADTVYMPPCVELHRCAPDSGCCADESEVCAPVDGENVTLPFYLNKADGNFSVARMVFFNHTRCACVSRDTLQSTIRTRIESRPKDSQVVRRESVASPERQNDWRSTEEPSLEKEEEPTAAPQLRRCTCPTLFLARPTDDGCSCVCAWPELSRRRDCFSLARGKEHFSLRDRVCITNGDCTPPSCEYGAYERTAGRCPVRKYRRIRFHHRSRPGVLTG